MATQTTSFDHVAASLTEPGLPHGTLVMTLAGVRPVEQLAEGARVVTRSGACRLRGVRRVRDNDYRLVFDTPQLVYLARQGDRTVRLFRAA